MKEQKNNIQTTTRTITLQQVEQLISSNRLTASEERFLRLKYGLSLNQNDQIKQIDMPEQTARVVHGLEAYLLQRGKSSQGIESRSLKKALLLKKLKNSD